jgi:hypothetical protein
MPEEEAAYVIDDDAVRNSICMTAREVAVITRSQSR